MRSGTVGSSCALPVCDTGNGGAAGTAPGPVPAPPVIPGARTGTMQAVEQHEQLSLESKYSLKTSDCKTVLN